MLISFVSHNTIALTCTTNANEHSTLKTRQPERTWCDTYVSALNL